MYDILKDILKEKGIGLEDFAQSLGITLNTLRRSLQANPTISKIQEIADRLSVHISVFFPAPEQPKKNGNTPDVSGFIKIDKQIYEIKNIEDLKDICISL